MCIIKLNELDRSYLFLTKKEINRLKKLSTYPHYFTKTELNFIIKAMIDVKKINN